MWHEGERISTPRSAGALLYDARELFDQQNAKADEGLRSIVASLPEAVATCVDAAQAELDETRQVALMKVCVHANLKKTLRYRYLTYLTSVDPVMRRPLIGLLALMKVGAHATLRLHISAFCKHHQACQDHMHP